MVQNKVACFYGSRCIYRIRQNTQRQISTDIKWHLHSIIFTCGHDGQQACNLHKVNRKINQLKILSNSDCLIFKTTHLQIQLFLFNLPTFPHLSRVTPVQASPHGRTSWNSCSRLVTGRISWLLPECFNDENHSL